MKQTWDEAVTGYDVTRAVARMDAADWPVRALYQISHAAWFDRTRMEDNRRYSVAEAGACIRGWIRSLPEAPDHVPDMAADEDGDRLLWLATSHLAEAQLRASSLDRGMDWISEDARRFLMRTRLAEVATCLAYAEQALSTWWDQRQRDGDR